MSVILFGLQVNWIIKNLTAGTECSLYVDDIVICYRSSTIAMAERQLQQCLNKLQIWADRNGFTFFKTTTVCMHFCNQRGLFPNPFLVLNGFPISIIEETKFLDIIFDGKLNFIAHLEHLKNKCVKALTKSGADCDAVMSVSVTNKI